MYEFKTFKFVEVNFMAWCILYSYFSTYKIFCHFLLVSTVSSWKSTTFLIVVSLYVMHHVSLAVFQRFFFVFSFYKFGYYVSWCCFLWISSIWDLFISLSQYVYAYHQIWEIFSHYFFKYFSPSQSSFLVGFWLPECYVFCYFSMVPVSLFLVYFWHIVQIG